MKLTVRIQTRWPGETLSRAFDAFPVTIGRAPGCALRLPLPFVSRAHAGIERVADALVLIDDRSRNGTSCNGTRIEPGKPARLTDGSEIRIKWMVLRVRVEEAADLLGARAHGERQTALAPVAEDDPPPLIPSAPRAGPGRATTEPLAGPHPALARAPALLGVFKRLGLTADPPSILRARPRSAASELQDIAGAHLPTVAALTDPDIDALLERLDVGGSGAPDLEAERRDPAPAAVAARDPMDDEPVIVPRTGVARLLRVVVSLALGALRSLRVCPLGGDFMTAAPLRLPMPLSPRSSASPREEPSAVAERLSLRVGEAPDEAAPLL